jgi:hypothetical protein
MHNHLQYVQVKLVIGILHHHYVKIILVQHMELIIHVVLFIITIKVN